MVSVIIPTFERYEFLCEAVDSVLDQQVSDLEVIVVDDGSSSPISRITERDPSVRYLRVDHSGMPGLVRNRGVAISRGAYLAFLDSDDLWQPGKLSRQLSYLEAHDEFDLVYTGELWMRSGRRIRQKAFRQGEGDVFSLALRRCMIGPSTVLMRRSLFDAYGGFREDLEICEDYELWLRITAEHAVGFLPEPLVTKRAGHGDQLSERYGYIEQFRIQALKELVDGEWFSSHGLPLQQQEAVEELIRKYGICGAGAMKRGRAEEGEAYLRLRDLYRQRPISS